jgi:hypothetical protein
MKKKARIAFDMEEIADISNELRVINKDYYNRRTNKLKGMVRFPIPTPIKAELDLKAGDTCFFCQYSEGFYISFNHQPAYATKAQFRSRKLIPAGEHQTLFVAIPPFIKNLYQEEITGIELIRTKGYQPYEWHIRFLFTDFI